MKDPREETQDDPEFSRQVKAEVGRILEARAARPTAGRRRLLAGAGVGVCLAVFAMAYAWRQRAAAEPPPVEALQAALALSDFEEGGRILEAEAWETSPSLRDRWRSAARALEREAEARARTDWKGAFDALAEALSAAGRDRWLAARVETLRGSLDAEVAAWGRLREARALADAGFAEEARKAAAGIPAGSVYRVEAEALLTLIARGLSQAAAEEPMDPPPPKAVPLERDPEALELYQAGRAAEAAELLVPGHPAAAAMRTTGDAYEKGLRHMTAGELGKAAGAFRNVLASDPMPGSWYSARAGEALGGIRQAARDFVPAWIESAEAQIAEERYAEALTLLRQAADVDPDAPRLAEVRRTLRAAKERLYQEGYILLDLDARKARQRWMLLLEILPDGDPLRSEIAARMPAE